MPSIINAATSGGLISTADTSGVLQLQTASTTAMTIDASQQVGIGTASPAVPLDVSKAGSNDKAVFRNATRTLYFNLDSAGGGIFTGAAQTGNYVYFDANGNSVQIATNGTERMRLNNSGTVILQGGSGTASGVGITFPATQSASSNANTLDDYEEGTFTPTIIGGITGLTYTSQEGFYTKVGRFVSYTLRVTISAGTAAGSMVEIGGLPFTPNANGNSQYFAGGLFVYASPSITGSLTTNLPTVYTPNNGNSIQLYRTDGDSLLGTQLNSASTFNGYFIGSYFTA